MAATPETRAKKEWKKRFDQAVSDCGYTVWVETHAGDAYSTPTLDITGTLTHPNNPGWGIPFAVELKRFDGKGKLTDRQRVTMDRMASAGISVFLIDSPESLEHFIVWMNLGCPRMYQPYTAAT